MDDHSEQWRDKSEERLRAFIENAPRKMWIARTDGTVEFFNREWRDYTGQTADTISQIWKDFVHPEDRPKLEETRTGPLHGASPTMPRSG